MKKEQAISTFEKGLVMDFNPMVTPKGALTNCLNGTILTFNGDENTLLNDMGNGRVETAFLPNGYIPIGTCSFGGIIYIASYNPEKDLCLIGCFPSPERNITSDEVSSRLCVVGLDDFIKEENGLPYIRTALKKTEFDNLVFNPGDFFKIYFGNKTEDVNKLTDYGNEEYIIGINPRILKIHIVSITDEGEITYLDDGLKWFEAPEIKDTEEKNLTTENLDTKQENLDNVPEFSELPVSNGEAGYIIAPFAETTVEASDEEVNLDKYRTLVSGPYNIFKARSKGKLGLFFELETIDTFSLTENVTKVKKSVTNSDGTIASKDYFNVDFNFYWDSKNDKYPKYIFLTDNNISELLNKPSLSPGGQNPDWGIKNIYEGYGYFNGPSNEEILNKKIERGFSFPEEIIKNDEEPYPIWNYELTPAMEYGLIKYLAINGNIDFNKIDSGEISVKSWRYYTNTGASSGNGSLLLSFDLSVYLKKDLKIDNVHLIFIPANYILTLKEDTFDFGKIVYSDEFSSESIDNGISIYTLENRDSYSGYFLLTIPYLASDPKLKGILLPNTFYIVKILIDGKIESEYKYFYKSVWTNPVFNKAYINKVELDFTNLKLSDYLDIYPKISSNSRLKTKESSKEISEETNKENSEESSSNGIKTYLHIVEIEESNIDLDVSLEFVNNYNTFGIDPEGEYIKSIEKVDSNKKIDSNKSNYIIIGTIEQLEDLDINNIEVTLNDNEITISGELTKNTYYTEQNSSVLLDNALVPLIHDESSLERLGLKYNKELNKFYFDSAGVMSYCNPSGKRGGLIFGIAKSSFNPDDSKLTYSYRNIRYGSPGNNDSHGVYYFGLNDVTRGKDNIDKIIGGKNKKGREWFVPEQETGFEDAIDGLGKEIGGSIMLMLYTGLNDDEDKVTKFSFGNFMYELDANTFITENGFNIENLTDGVEGTNPIAFSLYIKSKNNKYIPIYQTGWISNPDSDISLNNTGERPYSKNGEIVRRPLKCNYMQDLISFLMLLYVLSDSLLSIEGKIVSGMQYTNPYIVQLNIPLRIRTNISSNESITIPVLKPKSESESESVLYYTLSDLIKKIGNVIKFNNISISDKVTEITETESYIGLFNESMTVLGYGIYMDDSKKILELQERRNLNYTSGILKCTKEVVPSVNTYAPNQLYYLDGDIVKRLDKKFNPIKLSIEYLPKEDDFKVTPDSDSKVSDPEYNVAAYLTYENNELLLKNFEDSKDITMVISQASNTEGTIKQIPGIKLIKSMLYD